MKQIVLTKISEYGMFLVLQAWKTCLGQQMHLIKILEVDVSNVTAMDYMLSGAASFNQDLTAWCVTNITSEPTDFSIGSH